MKKKCTRIAKLLCAVLLLAALLASDYMPIVQYAQAVTQKEIDNLKDDAKDLAKRQAEQKKLISELKNDQSKAIQLRNLLDQQIATTEQAIVNTEKQIAGYEALLSQSQYELDEARREEEETYELFCRRARAMEEEGVPSFWSV
ncbi:MAG: peptidase M23, partial [Oscillospiraceae bacterium]|nr:peptidase M23 [Oscillospiraceae bacterium]